MLHYYLKRIFYQNIFSETYEDIGDGGPKCFNEMTIDFRILIAAITVFLLVNLS